jgi:hypothetical protein
VADVYEERTGKWWLREVTNGLLIAGWVLLLILLSSQGGVGG